MDRLFGLMKKLLHERRRDAFASRERTYSVVIAAYNVAPYLERCLQSLLAQNLSKSRPIEVIVVDDGSTDETGSLADRFAREFPTRIKVLHQANAGAAAARNLGLESATGDWVSFVDGDDFVAKDYFAVVDEFLSSTDDDPWLVCGNVSYFYERSGNIIDAHPLRFRFQQGPCTVDVFRAPKFLHLAAAQSFFKRELIEQHQLRFDTAVVPIFEDAHFTAKYLCLAERRHVSFLPRARYFYRKRRDQSSLVASSWKHPGRYDALLEHGYLDILCFGKDRFGAVPKYVQNLVLYDLRWLFVQLVDHDEHLSQLSPHAVERFVTLLKQILLRIEVPSIWDFDVIELPDFIRCGLIETMMQGQTPCPVVSVESYDPRTSTLVVSHAFTCERHERIFVDGREVTPLSMKTQTHFFAYQFFVYQRFIAVRVPAGSCVEVHIENDSAPIRLGLSRVTRVSTDQLRTEEKLQALRELTGFVPTWVGPLRHVASIPKVKRKFQDAWVFMDRDIQADDNAEHLYRYVRRQRPDIDAYFVLRRSSHDWKRLKHEGFRLLAFGSPRHKLLFLTAQALVSSHIDGYVVNLVPRKWFLDVLSHKFVFLQHGVTEGDISAWINQKKVDCIITAGAPEWKSIVTERNGYRFSEREVHLTGFPRHDALQGLRAARTRTIVVMPTWRKYVVGGVAGRTNRRKPQSGFAQTRYAQAWGGFLRSTELRELALRFGYRVVFFPHANIEPYLEQFQLPSHVETRTHRDGSIQRELGSASILITDYSSLAFDAAYLKRAVIYYQFDRAEFYSGEHLYSQGYFDHRRDGFGPCCEDESALMGALRTLLENEALPESRYEARMEEFFPYRDGENCRRVVEAVEATLVGSRS